jgi:hypothetical protein
VHFERKQIGRKIGYCDGNRPEAYELTRVSVLSIGSITAQLPMASARTRAEAIPFGQRKTRRPRRVALAFLFGGLALARCAWTSARKNGLEVGLQGIRPVKAWYRSATAPTRAAAGMAGSRRPARSGRRWPSRVSRDGNKWDGIYVGPRKGDDPIYAGKVDHGFDKTSAADLRKRLKPLIGKTQPYTTRIAHRGLWLEPKLLAEIEYRAKSAEGKVRHPFFKGLRENL